MGTVVDEERSQTMSIRDRVVIGELGQGQKVYPVVLIVIAEDSQKLLEGLVDSLCLSICLWVKGCRQINAGAQD